MPEMDAAMRMHAVPVWEEGLKTVFDKILKIYRNFFLGLLAILPLTHYYKKHRENAAGFPAQIRSANLPKGSDAKLKGLPWRMTPKCLPAARNGSRN